MHAHCRDVCFGVWCTCPGGLRLDSTGVYECLQGGAGTVVFEQRFPSVQRSIMVRATVCVRQLHPMALTEPATL
jgi:hypothetical protein